MFCKYIFSNETIVDINFGFLPKSSKEYKSYLHQFPELHFTFISAELTNEQCHSKYHILQHRTADERFYIFRQWHQKENNNIPAFQVSSEDDNLKSELRVPFYVCHQVISNQEPIIHLPMQLFTFIYTFTRPHCNTVNYCYQRRTLLTQLLVIFNELIQLPMVPAYFNIIREKAAQCKHTLIQHTRQQIHLQKTIYCISSEKKGHMQIVSNAYVQKK